jgi:hypothetical protein
MAPFPLDEFGALVPTPTISWSLNSAGWLKETRRRVASGRNAELRDYYLHNLSLIFAPAILCM